MLHKEPVKVKLQGSLFAGEAPQLFDNVFPAFSSALLDCIPL